MSKLLPIAVALSLASCAGDKALIVTGESLDALSFTFEATNTAMERGLDSKAVTVAQYRAWRTFGEKFAAAYPLACDLWRVAADTHDEQLQVQAAAAVAQLGADLGEWAALVGVR